MNEVVRYIRNVSLTSAVSFGFIACGADDSPKPDTFTEAVEQVAVSGGNVLLAGFSCDFVQLDSDTVEVQKILADETDFTGAVIADTNGEVTEFGNVQCIIREEGQIEIRGSDGY